MSVQILADALRTLHLALVERGRTAFEHLYGPVSAGQLLQLLTNDWFFAWLRPLSGLVAELDAAADSEAAIAQLEALFDLGAGTPFAEEYLAALQDPAVALAHAAVKRALATLPADEPATGRQA